MEYLISEEEPDEGLDPRRILESMIPNTLVKQPQFSVDLETKKDRELVRLSPQQGFQFDPLRMPYLPAELPHLGRYRTLILLRDPRAEASAGNDSPLNDIFAPVLTVLGCRSKQSTPAQRQVVGTHIRQGYTCRRHDFL